MKIENEIEWIRFPCKGGTQFKAKFTCPKCGQTRWVKRWGFKKAIRDGTYTGLCNSCRSSIVCSQNIGEKNPHWNGGRFTNGEGYCFVYTGRDSPYYGMADHRKYVLKHRLVMAKHLGRPLESKEVVHHIDENPSNNDIDNLMLFPNSGEHLAYHHAQKKLKAV